MKISLLWGAAAFVMWSGCSNPSSRSAEDAADDQTGVEAVPQSMPELASIAEDAPRLSNNAYDYTALVPLFPDVVSYAGRQTTGGENYKMGDGIVATATASYSHQDRRFSVSIHDLGDNKELIPGMAKWYGTGLQEDNETEFMSTTYIGDSPVFKHYYKDRRIGSINMVYKDRFVVDITGRNIDVSDLEKALADMHVERLK